MIEHEKRQIFIFSYLLSKFLMYKFGTLISEYNFVFSLWVETLVSIMLFVHVQNLRKDICIEWEIENPINIWQPQNGLNL
jgi:hypothetical protein